MKKRQPDEMEQRFEWIAAKRTYGFCKIMLLLWCGRELIRYPLTGTYNGIPYAIFIMQETVYRVTLLACRSRADDEEAQKELSRKVLWIVGTILFVIWIAGSLLTLPLADGK